MFTLVCVRSVASIASVVALTSIAAATTYTVDDSGGFDFTNIQSAIDAAFDGDTIMVRPGTYTDFLIEDKSLNVFAQLGNINVAGTVFIANLSKFKRVVLSGINATGRKVYPVSDQALIMNVNVGAVRFQNCTFTGGMGEQPSQFDCFFGEPYGVGGLGADVFYCTDLAFTGCTIVGGLGGGNPSTPGCIFSASGDAGHGVEARSSQIALYDCTVRGGAGGTAAKSGGDGGRGYHTPTGGTFASGTTFQGGVGGNSLDPVSFSDGGDGGDGMFVGANANVHLLGCTETGGAGGISLAPSQNGAAGAATSGTGVIDQLSGTRRRLTAPRIAPHGSIITVTILGQPGDQVFLPWSSGTGWRYRPINSGTWLIPLPARRITQPIGVIPASGSLTTKIQLAPLPPGLDAALTAMQCLVIDTQGNAILGSPMHILRK